MQLTCSQMSVVLGSPFLQRSLLREVTLRHTHLGEEDLLHLSIKVNLEEGQHARCSVWVVALHLSLISVVVVNLLVRIWGLRL